MDNLDAIVFAVVSFSLGIGFVLYGAFNFLNKRGAEQKRYPQIYLIEGGQARVFGAVEVIGGALTIISTVMALAQVDQANLAIFLAIVGGTLSFAALGLSIRRRFE